MTNSVRLGFGIAALFAAGVFAVSLFGHHDDWFLRAARDGAVRCLTKSPCVRIDSGGVVVPSAPPPLAAASRCARPGNWRVVEGDTPLKLLVTCTDGKTYLYHMGKIADPKAGAEQWMACAGTGCVREIALVKERMM